MLCVKCVCACILSWRVTVLGFRWTYHSAKAFSQEIELDERFWPVVLWQCANSALHGKAKSDVIFPTASTSKIDRFECRLKTQEFAVIFFHDNQLTLKNSKEHSGWNRHAPCSAVVAAFIRSSDAALCSLVEMRQDRFPPAACGGEVLLHLADHPGLVFAKLRWRDVLQKEPMQRHANLCVICCSVGRIDPISVVLWRRLRCRRF